MYICARPPWEARRTSTMIKTVKIIVVEKEMGQVVIEKHDIQH